MASAAVRAGGAGRSVQRDRASGILLRDSAEDDEKLRGGAVDAGTRRVLVGTAVVKAVQAATARGGRPGWMATDLDEGHYDYYYWVLTAMGVADFFYFLVCSWAYGEEARKKPWGVEGGTQ